MPKKLSMQLSKRRQIKAIGSKATKFGLGALHGQGQALGTLWPRPGLGHFEAKTRPRGLHDCYVYSRWFILAVSNTLLRCGCCTSAAHKRFTSLDLIATSNWFFPILQKLAELNYSRKTGSCKYYHIKIS